MGLDHASLHVCTPVFSKCVETSILPTLNTINRTGGSLNFYLSFIFRRGGTTIFGIKSEVESQ